MLRAAIALAGLWLGGAVNLEGQRPLVRRDTGGKPPLSTEPLSEFAPPLAEAAALVAQAPALAEDSLSEQAEGDEDETGQDEHEEHRYEHSKASEQDVASTMQAIDADQDGKLSWQEVLAFFNREGGSEELSSEELQAGGFGPMAEGEKHELKELFDTSDGDSDGHISRDELARFLSAQEATAEKDAQSAAAEGEAAGLSEGNGGIEGDDDDEQGSGESLLALGSKEAVELQEDAMLSFSAADANKDGFLSLAEALQQLEKEEAADEEHRPEEAPSAEAWRDDARSKFKAADKDGDDLLSKREFAALLAVEAKAEADEQEGDDEEADHAPPEGEEEEEGGASEEELAELGRNGKEEDEAGGEFGTA